MSKNEIIGAVVNPNPSTFIEHDPRPIGYGDFNWMLETEKRAPLELKQIENEIKIIDQRRTALIARKKKVEKILEAFGNPVG